MAEDARRKVLALVELAVGAGTPPHEATAAATAACRRIQGEGMFLDPDVATTPRDRGLLRAALESSGGEARAAALALCRRIKEGRLLPASNGLGHDEEASQARRPRRRGSSGSSSRRGSRSWEEEDESDVVLVTISFLILTQSDELYRVARLEPPKRHSSHVLLIPKIYVKNTVMMSPEESDAIGWRGSLVIKSMTLVRTYFDTARWNGWDQWR